MKSIKKISAIILVMAVALSTLFVLASCGEKREGYLVGIVQLAEHKALDDATRGFKDALKEKLGDKVSFDFKNAQGSQDNLPTIVNGFVQKKVDLIMGNATNAVKAAKEATKTIPIVGTSVTDYVGSKLVTSNEKPGGNVTGASDNTPVSVQVDLMKKLCPDVKVVGIVYNSGEENSKIQADEAKAAFEAKGFTVRIFTVSETSELQTTLTQACNEVDGFYLPTDNLIASNMQLIKNVTVYNKKPVICAEDNIAKEGGLASYSINFYKLGYEAGLMAYEILENGKKPADMPIFQFSIDNLELYINEDIAEEIGITIPDDIQN